MCQRPGLEDSRAKSRWWRPELGRAGDWRGGQALSAFGRQNPGPQGVTVMQCCRVGPGLSMTWGRARSPRWEVGGGYCRCAEFVTQRSKASKKGFRRFQDVKSGVSPTEASSSSRACADCMPGRGWSSPRRKSLLSSPPFYRWGGWGFKEIKWLVQGHAAVRRRS